MNNELTKDKSIDNKVTNNSTENYSTEKKVINDSTDNDSTENKVINDSTFNDSTENKVINDSTENKVINDSTENNLIENKVSINSETLSEENNTYYDSQSDEHDIDCDIYGDCKSCCELGECTTKDGRYNMELDATPGGGIICKYCVVE